MSGHGHGHRFNPEHLKRLDSPERRKMLPPEKILSDLGVTGEVSVLDIGAGAGYFAIPAAKMTSGTVHALDVQSEMLEALAERAGEEGATNIATILSEGEKIPLADASVDRVICSMVAHEFFDLHAVMSEVRRVLRPDGKSLFIDWERKEMEMGPPLHERIAEEDLVRAFEGSGFHVLDYPNPNDKQYAVLAEVAK